MATYGQSVTAVNITLQKPPPAGTATQNFVVPADAEADVLLRLSVSTAGASTTSRITNASFGTIYTLTATSSTVVDYKVLLPAGTYVLEAISPGGVSTATVQLLGVIRQY